MRRKQQDERWRPCSLARGMDGDRCRWRWQRMRQKQQDERRRDLCLLAGRMGNWGSAKAYVGRYCEAKNSAPDNSDQWQHRVPTAKPSQVFI
uniref:Uncharacterized protein n=1 Tax=Oryza punctata TaxID=4537 RepID=A0A0E0LQ83_ORYPU